MTIFELAYFIGLPGWLAYCFTFPLKDSFKLTLGIGAGSAVLSALIVFLFGAVFRVAKHRLPAGAVFPAWSSIAPKMVTMAGVFAIQQSRFAFLGIPASFAVFIAVVGPQSWRKVGGIYLLAVFLACITLRIFVL